MLSREHADLTDSVHKLDDELSAVQEEIKSTHDCYTTLAAIVKTTEVHIMYLTCVCLDLYTLVSPCSPNSLD